MQNLLGLAERRLGLEHLESTIAVSERHSCHGVGIPRSTERRSAGCSEGNFFSKIHELSGCYPRFDYRKIFNRLKLTGWRVGPEPIRLTRR